jgi:hypothetical protein
MERNSLIIRTNGPHSTPPMNQRSFTNSNTVPSRRLSASSSMKQIGSGGKGSTGSEATTESTQAHWATLTFKEKTLESEYEKFAFQKSIYSWRRNIAMIALVATFLHMSIMASDEIHSSFWRSTYANDLKGGITSSNVSQYCPKGWFWYVFQCSVQLAPR